MYNRVLLFTAAVTFKPFTLHRIEIECSCECVSRDVDLKNSTSNINMTFHFENKRTLNLLISYPTVCINAHRCETRVKCENENSKTENGLRRNRCRSEKQLRI